MAGDVMGIYVVDYENEVAGTLSESDNRGSNVLFTYGDDGTWTSPTTLYWRDQVTPVDVYGYYPGANYIAQPTAWQFEVQSNQDTEARDGDLSGYEKSDLLWGKEVKVQPTDKQIVVKYNHILAGVRVQLNKGTGFSDDAEWEKLEKIVLVENTVRQATVDLSAGTTTINDSTVSPVRMLTQSNDEYRAVVIPQQVDAGKQLLSITIDGQSYSHSLPSGMDYERGKLHEFTITVNKRTDGSGYDLTVSYDGITPWTNDEVSHQFSAMMYVTVNCPEAGKLREAITNAGYDYKTIQNLKVTGEITNEDFELMRTEMPELKHLNLKEVVTKNIQTSMSWDQVINIEDDALPANAFYHNKTIRSLVLPTSIKKIGPSAFRELQLQYSTLEVPEGVTTICDGAFMITEDSGVELMLPNSLESIGAGAFHDCGYKCELKLSDHLKYIGENAFDNTPKFHGVFHIPAHIESLTEEMFNGLGKNGSFTGEIEIPQGFTAIPGYAFGVSLKNRVALTIPQGVKVIGEHAFGGMRLTSLQLNDDLREVKNSAFDYASMPFSITLPEGLRSVGENSFRNCLLEGELTIPERCLNIGKGAFSQNFLTKINLPSKLENIDKEAFKGNSYLTSITIPKYVSMIGEKAFADDGALQTVICLNPEPPVLESNAFEGVYFDKCILQVPEASLEAYRHATGWSDFKNITAYHELAISLSEISALDKGQTATAIVRAEGNWTVNECPDWVTVSPTSGSTKTEVTITVQPMSGSESREGKIVFKLSDKDYSTYTTVKQQTCTNKEDETIVLQTASAGASKAIPIFIIGEGYNADDIVSDQYLKEMKQQMEHLFSIEPYKSYRNYFTVSTAIAVSPEHGIDGRTRFNSEIYGTFQSDYDAIWQYAKEHGEGITDDNEGQVTIVVVMNTSQTANTTQLEDNGRAISLIGKSTDSYPFDQKSYVLREVGGIAFGKLGVESVNHFTFLKTCTCPGCADWEKYNRAKRLGWYENISVTGKMNDVPWRDLIFDETYAKYVDIYEGGFGHARGAYRSENASIMGNTFIPYFNTISRLSIVKRILDYSGEGYTFDKFKEKDNIEIPQE